MIDLSKTIDLSTTYLGLKLRNPMVASSSPLCEDLATIRRMEDAGAAAVVLQSLFEEQIEFEANELDRFLGDACERSPEAITHFPELSRRVSGPDAYLEHIRRCKQAVKIPIIASLNGSTLGGWFRYAKLIEDAGADALEINVYYLPADLNITGEQVEQHYVDVVRALKAEIHIPLAVKLGPYFSSMANMARKLDNAGADALVLFNRFYQPDYDLETLEVVPNLVLSNSHELLLRLHWVALLYGAIRAELAVTGGVHMATDVVKAMMAGARITMLTSALLKRGPGYFDTLLNELLLWMSDHEYDSIKQMQGSMSRNAVPQPKIFERTNYIRVLGSYAMR
jgi:dihydroorotate dehydrogenase (fumarate)